MKDRSEAMKIMTLGLALGALLAAPLAAGGLPPVSDRQPHQPDVIRVTKWGASDYRTSMLSGIATRYDPELHSKEQSELTAGDQRRLLRMALAIKVYHNAIAQVRGQGRRITDADLIIDGESLYVPPKDVIDDILAIIPEDPSQGLPPFAEEQILTIVLADVDANKDLIEQSSQRDQLTPRVLAQAEDVARAQDQAENTIVSPPKVPVVKNQDTDLADDAGQSGGEPGTFLGDQGEPISRGSGDDDADPSRTERDQTAAPGTGEGDASANDADLPSTLRGERIRRLTDNQLASFIRIFEAQDTETARRGIEAIRAEQERRRVEAEQAAETTVADSGDGDAGRRSTGKDQADRDQATVGESSGGGPGRQTVERTRPNIPTVDTGRRASGGGTSRPLGNVEVVPDWYLRALQEWNLGSYWEGDKGEGGGEKPKYRDYVYDPATGEKRRRDDYEDPYQQYSDELTNIGQDQKEARKREDWGDGK